MPLGSQINVDPAASTTPQTVAAESIGGKLYDGVVVCDAAGNIVGTQANPLTVRPSRPPSYTALYRLAARPYALSFAFAAAARKQYATVFHPATATKILRLKRVRLAVRTISAAAIISGELVRLTNATTPATGNPAITAQAHGSDPAPESTALALPTTAGTEAAGSPYASVQWETAAATGAIASTNPPTITTPWQDLYTENLSDLDDSPSVAAATAGGFAVVLDSNAAATVTALVMIEWTEET